MFKTEIEFKTENDRDEFNALLEAYTNKYHDDGVHDEIQKLSRVYGSDDNVHFNGNFINEENAIPDPSKDCIVIDVNIPKATSGDALRFALVNLLT